MFTVFICLLIAVSVIAQRNPTAKPTFGIKPTASPTTTPTAEPTMVQATAWGYLAGASAATCGYDPILPCGPANWNILDEQCAATSGQSPINIVSTIVERSPYMFGPVAGASMGGCKVWNETSSSGNILTVDYGTCHNLYVVLDGVHWTLNKIQIHSVSEHAIGGGKYPAEAQFYHTNAAGDELAIAIFLTTSTVAGQSNNAFLEQIWDRLVNTNELAGSVTVPTAVNPYSTLTPANPAQYHYTGSATTPPCTTDVQWYIFEQPVTISTTDLAHIRAISAVDGTFVVDEEGNNNRPLQSTANTMVYYIPGGIALTPTPTLAPVYPTMEPTMTHRMPRNALIVGGVAIALAGVLLIAVLILFVTMAINHTSATAKANGAVQLSTIEPEEEA